MINGRVMVPIRGVFEHMNAAVSWDPRTRVVTAHRGQDDIRLTINSYSALVNGRQVRLDSPATMVNGRTMVPLRFLSETLGASVEWIASSRLVEITTASANTNTGTVPAGYTMMRMDSGEVIPFILDQSLGSNTSSRGDRFTAKMDHNGSSHGAILEGHVVVARPRDGNTPGVLGLAFDRVRMPNGVSYAVNGSLMGLDANSVETRSGHLVARSGVETQNLKYVGFGQDAVLLPIWISDNVLTNTIINEKLGSRYQEIRLTPSKSHNVMLERGTRIGVRLSNDLSLRIPTSSQK